MTLPRANIAHKCRYVRVGSLVLFLEVCEHCEYPTMVFVGWQESEFGEDVADMFLYGSEADVQGFCDRGVRSALGHES